MLRTYVSVQVIAEPGRFGGRRSGDARIFREDQIAFRARNTAGIITGKGCAVTCHAPEPLGIQAPGDAELGLAHNDLAISARCSDSGPTRGRSSTCTTNKGCEESKGCEKHGWLWAGGICFFFGWKSFKSFEVVFYRICLSVTSQHVWMSICDRLLIEAALRPVPRPNSGG